MSTLTTLSLVLAALTPALAMATQSRRAPAEHDDVLRTISVSGEGQAVAKPDIATVVLGTEVTADSLTKATAAATVTMTGVINALNAAGVADEDIQTINFSVFPEQPTDPQTGLPGPVRYRVVNQVQVKIHDLKKVGPIIDKGIAAGANQVFGINFGVENPEPVLAQARAAAVTNAQNKARQLATLSGVALGKVIRINEGSSQPIPFAGERLLRVAAAAPPIQPGQLEFTVNVDVTYEIK